MKTVDSLLRDHLNLFTAVGILIDGCRGKRPNALSDWDQFRRKDRTPTFKQEQIVSKITVTKEQVQAIIAEADIEDRKMGKKTTAVCAILPNGFVIVESASCVDPENYDHEMGKKICLERLETKVWELEGYLLQSKQAA